MCPDKNRAVFPGKHTTIRYMAACPRIKLCVAIAPVQITIDLGSLYPESSQLVTVLYGIMDCRSVLDLLLSQSCSLFSKALRFFPLSSFTGSTGRFRLLRSLRCGRLGSRSSFLLCRSVGMPYHRSRHTEADQHRSATTD